MLVKKANSISITTIFNNNIVTLDDSEEWSIWLKDVRDLSDNTIRTFMKSMSKFWEWSLYNPIGLKESFPSFQARYRNSLREGFVIKIKSYSKEFDDEIEIIVLECKPLKKVTINKEIAGINSYFYFTEESELIDDHRFINQLHERHKAARSFLAGIQIKKSELALEVGGAKIKYLPPYKTPKNRQKIKYFPLELFDELLEMSKPREKLLYLLCGACSARIGQALNLTLYDIDYEKQEIWLLNPKNDDEDIYGNQRRVWLRDEYDINISGDCEHNSPDLQFKYPIPVYHEPIYWLNEKYKEMFFHTLKAYMKSSEYVSEFARYPRHPFFFVTKTGKRVHARDALSRLKTAMKKLYARHPSDEYRLLFDLGFHSLRHMFGHARAELYAGSGNESLIYITMNEMGHSSMESTLVYFNLSRESMKRIIQGYMDKKSKELSK